MKTILSQNELREIEHLLVNKTMQLEDDIYEATEHGTYTAIANLKNRLASMRKAYKHITVDLSSLSKEDLSTILDIVQTKIVYLNNDFYNVVCDDADAEYFNSQIRMFEGINEKLKKAKEIEA
jgi:hypothetical protein